MTTPVCDFVRSYAASDPIRMHMPGHKGGCLLGPESLDITEIPGADVLYHAAGIIRESEQNAAVLFGTQATFYSTEGSSLVIRAMLYLAAAYAAVQGRRPLIAAGRNAHKVFITASALLDIPVSWLWPETAGALTRCLITPEALEAFLAASPECPTAVYITSPDYLGNLADIPGLSRVCRRFGCLLLVDNAHGAYLNFLSPGRHPIALGADLCCDSAHKTLPALTGAAYLHISRDADPFFAKTAEQALALFASTSPSYLILQSLDLANAYLAESFSSELENAVRIWDAFRQKLHASGFQLTGSEPLKLSILTKPLGYTGDELSSLLQAQNILSEFSDPDHLVWMLPVRFSEELPARLLEALLSIPKRPPLPSVIPSVGRPIQVISAHEALLSASEEILAAFSAGRIMASASVSCPPAVPVVAIGERIDSDAVQAMQYYGIEYVRVLCR